MAPGMWILLFLDMSQAYPEISTSQHPVPCGSGRGLKEAQQASLVLLMVFTCDISFTKVLGVPQGKFDWFRGHGYSPLTWRMRRNIVRTYWEKLTTRCLGINQFRKGGVGPGVGACYAKRGISPRFEGYTGRGVSARMEGYTGRGVSAEMEHFSD